MTTTLKPTLKVALAVIAVAVLFAGPSVAVDLAPVKLPAPQTDGGKPLMQALMLRSTSRSFAPDAIPAQTLSNLLWAAWGINRPADGKRTAPSARNWQEMEVVVVRADGAFVYDAAGNTLQPLTVGDHRALTGVQPFVKDAPVTLLFIADKSRVKSVEKDATDSWMWADAGFISQNVYLYCASEGLATGVRALIDRPALAKALGLGEQKAIIMAQCVGYPKK